MTTQTAEQAIAQERAEIWRAAAALTREHRAGVHTFGGQEAETVERSLWHLAKSFDDRADAAERGER